MKSRDFCYWLQGAIELSQAKQFDEKQMEILKKHLNMVFVHEIDPTFGGEKEQKKLNEVHTGGGGFSKDTLI